MSHDHSTLSPVQPISRSNQCHMITVHCHRYSQSADQTNVTRSQYTVTGTTNQQIKPKSYDHSTLSPVQPISRSNLSHMITVHCYRCNQSADQTCHVTRSQHTVTGTTSQEIKPAMSHDHSTMSPVQPVLALTPAAGQTCDRVDTGQGSYQSANC